MGRGAFMGLCIGISAAAVLVIALLMNNYYTEKYESSSLFGGGSLFDSGSLFGGGDADDSGLGGLFGSADDPSNEEDEDAAALREYVDSEIDRETEDNLYYLLSPDGEEDLSGLEIDVADSELYFLCYLPEGYSDGDMDVLMEELDARANERNRAEVVDVLREDIYDKTEIRDTGIIFLYYDYDGYYITEYAY